MRAIEWESVRADIFSVRQPRRPAVNFQMAIEAKAFEWSEPKMQRGITLAILVDVMGKICVSRERLGMMLSLSRQTVNELLRHLEQESIIHCQRGGVRILDSSRLRDAAPGFLVRRGSIASYN